MHIASSLTIGKLAGRSGVSAQTIRYYERNGLLPQPARTTTGYRIYSESAVNSLRFIKHAQALGFSLSEIQELLSLRTRPDTTCADIRQRAWQKIVDVDKKIEDLQRIKGALANLAGACPGNAPTRECPIIEALESERNEQLT
jgi:MerR family mercuric resistance operon transcriptional regulator